MNNDYTCWVVTEGLAGTENQCLGLAEALGLKPVVKRIQLNSPWRELSPYLRIANHRAISKLGDQIAPPYPDLLIASGRKSIAASLAIKKLSPKTVRIQIQDPRINPKHFDLVVVPQHDKARGKNVMVTVGALHKVTKDLLNSELKKFAHLLDLKKPVIAVLIGGKSKAHDMPTALTEKICFDLKALQEKMNASVLVTASRRTGENNRNILKQNLSGKNFYFWDGEGANPYFAYLAIADYIFVTNDSVSMASEALETGKPLYVIPLVGGGKRLNLFHALLVDQGYSKEFDGTIDDWVYTPPHDTDKVKERVLALLKERTNAHVTS